MGFIIPLTLGALSSATISFVYKASSFRMDETHAMMWGCGQTVVHASFGITRILATLWGASIVPIERECSNGTQFKWKRVSLENKAWYSLIGPLKCSTKIYRQRKKTSLIRRIIFKCIKYLTDCNTFLIELFHLVLACIPFSILVYWFQLD